MNAASLRRIEDLYIDGGRLRLRAVSWLDDGRREFKLAKKYEPLDPYAAPLTNVYLTQAEHDALDHLAGRRLAKLRYSVPPFGVDVFEGPLAGLVLTEYEAETREDALAVAAPDWALCEVTDDPRYWGWSLAQAQAVPAI